MAKANEIDKEIAKTIKALRRHANLTQPAVAGHLGIAYQSYQRMEQGKVSFRASTIHRLANLYHIPVAQIFTGVFTPSDPVVIRASLLVLEMDDRQRGYAMASLIKIKHGAFV